MGLASPASAQEQSTEELAKKAQNPIADLISVQIQSNTNFAAFYNVATPRGGAKWQARFQVQLLFPK
jgi:hypothetical protein